MISCLILINAYMFMVENITKYIMPESFSGEESNMHHKITLIAECKICGVKKL